MAYRLKTPDEIASIALAAAAVWRVIGRARNACKPGTTAVQIDELVRAGCGEEGLIPSMPLVVHPQTGVPFPGVCSVSVNDEAAHAPPSDRAIEPGDLVTLDLAASLDGWHADLATSWVVSRDDGSTHAERERLVAAARRVTQAAIDAIRPGGRWSEVAAAARAEAVRLGVSILPGLGGHGVGHAMHEPPQARFDATPGSSGDFTLAPGLALTVEPIVTLSPDRPADPAVGGWAVRTASGGPAACEERTVAVTAGGAWVLSEPGRGGA